MKNIYIKHCSINSYISLDTFIYLIIRHNNISCSRNPSPSTNHCHLAYTSSIFIFSNFHILYPIFYYWPYNWNILKCIPLCFSNRHITPNAAFSGHCSHGTSHNGADGLDQVRVLFHPCFPFGVQNTAVYVFSHTSGQCSGCDLSACQGTEQPSENAVGQDLFITAFLPAFPCGQFMDGLVSHLAQFVHQFLFFLLA